MKKSTLIIVIIGIVIVVGAIVAIVITRKGVVPPPEEVILTPEEQARLVLTEEERAKGLTLEEKEKQVLEQKKEAVQKGEPLEVLQIVQIRKIIDKKIKFPVFSADKQKFLYFNPDQKEFFAINVDGTGELAITLANFENLYDVVWSRDRDKLILIFSTDFGKTREYHYFNLAERKDTKLHSKLQDATFSFDGQKIAYIWRDAAKKTNNLSVSDPDGTNFRKIRTYGEEPAKLIWFSEENTAAFTPPSAYTQGNLLVYNVVQGGDYYGLISQKWGLSPLFSRDGKKIIFNDNGAKNARFPVLWVSSTEKGSTPKKLQVATLVEKCTWANDNVTIFCGVPENYSNFYIQPDDYYEGRFISRDSFYKINTDTGEQVKLASVDQFDQDYDVFSPSVSDDGKRLYFIRKHDEKFYALIVP
jgi:Tol biopolymer transport system component